MGNSLGIGALLGPTNTDYGWQKKNKKTRSALSLGTIHGGQKKKHACLLANKHTLEITVSSWGPGGWFA